MAKRSKAFSELQRLSKQKKERGPRDNEFKSFEQKLRKENISFDRIITAANGELKMSEVLGDFLEPYYQFTTSEIQMKMLLHVGMIAWNASLFSPEKQQEIIDDFIRHEFSRNKQALKPQTEEFIHELIERKKQYFSEYQRMIFDFELKDVGQGYELLVLSSSSFNVENHQSEV